LNVTNGITATALTGTLQTAAQPNVTSVGNLSSLTVAGVSVGPEVAYLSGSVPGTAAVSKAVVLDETGSIIGLNSISATSISGTLQTAAQPNVTSVGTLSSLNVTNGITATALTGTLQTAAQPNVTSVGNLPTVSIAGFIIGNEASYLSGCIAGTAVASKVVVLGSTGNVDGITSLTATTLTGTLQTASQPNITSVGNLPTVSIAGSAIGNEASYLSGSVAGTALASKAMVLDSSKSISGITSLSATNITGTLLSAAQPNVTSVGTLTGVTISGSAAITSTSDATGSSSGALVIAGGVGISKRLYVGTGIYGTISTPAQPSITSLGSLTGLAVNGTVNVTGSILINGVPVTAGTGTITPPPDYVLSITPGTATNSKALVLNSAGSVSGISSLSATQLSGQLQTGAQPLITQIGTLSNLVVTNGVVAGNLTGTLQTAAQPNITSLGILTALNVNGATTFMSAVDSTSLTTGSVKFNGGVAITRNLNIGGSLNVIGSIKINGVAIGTGSGGSGGSSAPDYVLGITAGTAVADKALVLDSAGAISGITSLNASILSGSLSSSTQTGITQVGTLGSLSVTGPTTIGSIVDATSSTNGGALTISGGVAVAKSLYVGNNLHVSGSLYINNTLVDPSSGGGDPNGYLSVTAGTASASKALVLNTSKNISGINALGTNSLSINSSSVYLHAGDVWAQTPASMYNAWAGACWSPELALFVAVGNQSSTTRRVQTSPDGINWTSRVSDLGSWSSVCWSPERSLFVAVALGGSFRAMTSPDGINWTTRTLSSTQWYSVCWSSQLSLFVACGNNVIATSPDGITWTARTPSASGSTWSSVCWAPELSLFVAVANNGTSRSMTSPDGVTWTTRTIDATHAWRSICWSPDLRLFVTVANAGSNRLATSLNGTTWTYLTPPDVTAGWTSVCWAPEASRFIAGGTYGTSNNIMTSANGITWVGKNTPIAFNVTNVCWSGSLKRVIGPCLGSVVFYSDHSTTSAKISANSVTNGLIVPSLKVYGTQYVSSQVGSTWTQSNINAGSFATCWSEELGLFVAVQTNTSSSVYYTSTDGITWVYRSLGVPAAGYTSVCWSPALGLFVAVSSGSTTSPVITSPDGLTWTTRTPATVSNWTMVCWSPQLQLFVAVSTSGPIMRSSDGIVWTSSTNPLPSGILYSVCWADKFSSFFAVFSNGTDRLIKSADGINWQIVSSPVAQASAWLSICWSNELSKLVAVGYLGAIMVSQDGDNWTSVTAISTNQWRVVSWIPEASVFVVGVAGGTYAVATSPDGTTWTPQSMTNPPSSFAWSPKLSLLVCAGGSGTYYSQHVVSNYSAELKALTGDILTTPNKLTITSTNSTALAVSGGISVAANATIAGTLTMSSQINATSITATGTVNSSSAGTSIFSGGFNVGGNLTVTGAINMTGTINATILAASGVISSSSTGINSFTGTVSSNKFATNTASITYSSVAGTERAYSFGTNLTLGYNTSGTDSIHRSSFYVGSPTITGNGGIATTTNASTLFISSAPVAGSNMTITNTYALYVNSGRVFIADTGISNSTTTGALVVTGGIGCNNTISARKVAVSGNISYSGTPESESFASFGTSGLLLTNGSSGNNAVDSTHRKSVSVTAPLISATSTSVTTTNASTLFISGAPTASTNMTITNAYALYVNSGKVNIADTTASTNATTGALVVAGGAGIAGDIYVGGNGVFTGTVTQASDIRLKKNIAPLNESEVKSLYETEVVTYNWKQGDEHEQVGVIAQDLVKQGLFNLVYSQDNESIVEGEDPVLNPAKKQWSVSYSGIAAYNMKMIQMLIAENEALKQRLAALEQK
jgi:hypothetical protein